MLVVILISLSNRVSDLYGKVTSSEDRDEETAQGTVTICYYLHRIYVLIGCWATDIS